MLCEPCQWMFSWGEEDWPTKRSIASRLPFSKTAPQTLDGRHGKFAGSSRSLGASAEAGCHLCATVWGSLTEEKRDQIDSNYTQGKNPTRGLYLEFFNGYLHYRGGRRGGMKVQPHSVDPEVGYLIFGFPVQDWRPGTDFIPGAGILRWKSSVNLKHIIVSNATCS